MEQLMVVAGVVVTMVEEEVTTFVEAVVAQTTPLPATHWPQIRKGFRQAVVCST